MYIKDGKIVAEGLSEEYLTDVEGLDNRTDAKWFHPELANPDMLNAHGDPNATSRINDPDISREERIKRRDEYMTALLGIMSQMELPEEQKHFNIETYDIPGLNEGDPALKVHISKPKNNTKKDLPVLFVIGQGAMLYNDYKITSYMFEEHAKQAGDVAICFVDARTGADVYYPAPLDDYQAGYQWLLDNGKELGLDPDNVVLYGESGGAYVVICFAFRCKDVGFSPKGCVSREPIIDDRLIYPSNKIVAGVWDSLDVHRSWKAIIKPADQFSPFLPPEIMPNHATVEECKGLCPMYIHAMEIDGDRDATMDFVSKCYQAKVFTQFHIWGGVVHSGFAFAQEGSLMKKSYEETTVAEISDMFKYDLRRQWLSEEK